MQFDSKKELSEEAQGYLYRCASIRQVSRTYLLQQILKAVCEDQLVLGILDDDSKPMQNTTSRYHKPRDRS
jgi:hypothetical protein